MQERRFVGAKVSQRDFHNIPSAYEASLCVPDWTTTLPAYFFKPPIQEVEVLTAMIDLVVFVPGWTAIPHDRQVLRSTIAHPRQSFGEMDRGIGVVPDTQQEHLPI
jgi:hypothetical protein